MYQTCIQSCGLQFNSDSKMDGYPNNFPVTTVPMGMSCQDSYFHTYKGLQLLMTGDGLFPGILNRPFQHES